MEDELKNRLQKGTTTVGLVCRDGIVLAADKRATMGYRIGHKKIDKVHKISEYMAITMAGLVSDAQLITKLIKAELSLKKIRTSREPTVNEAANLLGAIVYGNVRRPTMIGLSIVGFILGGKDDTGFKLYNLGIDGSILLYDDFSVDGSGSDLALGVLDTLYKKGISVNEGIQLAIKTINAAVQRDTPTGDGIDIVTITTKGVEKVLTKTYETKFSS